MSEVSAVGAQISWFMLQSNYIRRTPVPMRCSPWANFLIVLGLGWFCQFFFNWPISPCFYPESQNKTRRNVCGRSIPWREQAWLRGFFPTPFLFAPRYSLPSLVLQTGFTELQSVMPKMSKCKCKATPSSPDQSVIFSNWFKCAAANPSLCACSRSYKSKAVWLTGTERGLW